MSRIEEEVQEDKLSRIEDLKRPYEFPMEDNWEDVKEYYGKNLENCSGQ